MVPPQAPSFVASLWQTLVAYAGVNPASAAEQPVVASAGADLRHQTFLTPSGEDASLT